MKRSNASLISATAGLLLILAGFLWLSMNYLIDRNGAETAERTINELRKIVPVRQTEPLRADETDERIESAETTLPEEIPDYIAAPKRDMPVRDIDGVEYIAQLAIPSMGLELPVASEWSYETLAISPCRYYGSAYLHNLVILAHNYSRHFALLRFLSDGDEIDITDMDGNLFRYQVRRIETMKSDAVLDMIGSGYDLSLFTCTADGTMRLCVRCSLSEDIPMLLSAEAEF